MPTKDELKATNLALITALDEAISEYEYTLEYKSDYLVEKHKDRETVQELKDTLEAAKSNGRKIFKYLQADTIKALKFPVELRKMWSGGEVQDWLTQQASQQRKG